MFDVVAVRLVGVITRVSGVGRLLFANSSHSRVLPPRPQIQALWEDVQRLGENYLVVDLAQSRDISAAPDMAVDDADTLSKWHVSSGLEVGPAGNMGNEQDINHQLVSKRDVFLETCQVSLLSEAAVAVSYTAVLVK